jgi:hypothetical protein
MHEPSLDERASRADDAVLQFFRAPVAGGRFEAIDDGLRILSVILNAGSVSDETEAIWAGIHSRPIAPNLSEGIDPPVRHRAIKRNNHLRPIKVCADYIRWFDGKRIVNGVGGDDRL